MSNATERQQRVIAFDSSVFALAAVKKAAYRFTRSFSADISIHGGEIRCVLHLTPTISASASDTVVDEFKKEVLDQDLRERLKAETEALRNLILAHAFSRAGIGDEQVSED